jgi:hypothetical protein
MAKEKEMKELPNLDSNETVEVTFRFPSTTITISNVSKGRARLTCRGLCKAFPWKQE